MLESVNTIEDHLLVCVNIEYFWEIKYTSLLFKNMHKILYQVSLILGIWTLGKPESMNQGACTIGN